MADLLPSGPPQCPPAYSIGCKVKLQTQDGTVDGEVFAFDSGAGVIALQQPGSTPFHQHLRLIKDDIVQSGTHDAPPSGMIATTELPVVDKQRSREREERAVRAAQLEAAKIGVGVTAEAQKVFDALAKTLPCRWDDKTIVVLEEVSPARGWLCIRHCLGRPADRQRALADLHLGALRLGELQKRASG